MNFRKKIFVCNWYLINNPDITSEGTCLSGRSSQKGSTAPSWSVDARKSPQHTINSGLFLTPSSYPLISRRAQFWGYDRGNPLQPPEPRKNQSDSKVTKKWILGGSTKVTQKWLFDRKVTQKWPFWVKSHFWVTLVEPPQRSLFSHFWVTLIFSGFGGL